MNFVFDGDCDDADYVTVEAEIEEMMFAGMKRVHKIVSRPRKGVDEEGSRISLSRFIGVLATRGLMELIDHSHEKCINEAIKKAVKTALEDDGVNINVNEMPPEIGRQMVELLEKLRSGQSLHNGQTENEKYDLHKTPNSKAERP